MIETRTRWRQRLVTSSFGSVHGRRTHSPTPFHTMLPLLVSVAMMSSSVSFVAAKSSSRTPENSGSTQSATCNDDQINDCRQAVINKQLDSLPGGGECIAKQYVHFSHLCTVTNYLPTVDYCCCAAADILLCCRYHQDWNHFRCMDAEDVIDDKEANEEGGWSFFFEYYDSTLLVAAGIGLTLTCLLLHWLTKCLCCYRQHDADTDIDTAVATSGAGGYGDRPSWCSRICCCCCCSRQNATSKPEVGRKEHTEQRICSTTSIQKPIDDAESRHCHLTAVRGHRHYGRHRHVWYIPTSAVSRDGWYDAPVPVVAFPSKQIHSSLPLSEIKSLSPEASVNSEPGADMTAVRVPVHAPLSILTAVDDDPTSSSGSCFSARSPSMTSLSDPDGWTCASSSGLVGSRPFHPSNARTAAVVVNCRHQTTCRHHHCRQRVDQDPDELPYNRLASVAQSQSPAAAVAALAFYWDYVRRSCSAISYQLPTKPVTAPIAAPLPTRSRHRKCYYDAIDHMAAPPGVSVVSVKEPLVKCDDIKQSSDCSGGLESGKVAIQTEQPTAPCPSVSVQIPSTLLPDVCDQSSSVNDSHQ